MTSFLEGLSDTIEIDKTKCIYCGTCVERCILDNIRLKLSPCRNECPLGVNCQGYAQLIAREEFEKASEVVRETLPFPGIIGRICHHPCEAACIRNNVDGQPVALRILKRYLADYEWNYELNNITIKELPKRIAIIGGGPAGLMAAYNLRKLGYQVEIFEASSTLGGAVAHYIPQFRLPIEVVLQECNQIEKLGVHIHYNTLVGKDISVQEIIEKYDAVIVATGCTQSKHLGLEGEKASNVYGAIDFLEAVKNDKLKELGANVLVIGGGNTAIDAAQTAIRLGAEDVRIVCLESRDEMPAFNWEVKDALEEGVIIENKWSPAKIILENGAAREVEFKKCLSVYDKNGSFSPIFAEGQRKSFSVDTVIVAIGQNSDLEFLNGSKVEVEKCLINANPITFQTNMPKVFAAGDIVTGPRTAIEAMAQGREAADSVHRFLENLSLTYGRKCKSAGYIIDFDIDTSSANIVPRVLPKKNTNCKRSFDEIECGITKEQAIQEAKRCISCGEPYGKYKTCWECLACEVDCPEEALKINVPYLMR